MNTRTLSPQAVSSVNAIAIQTAKNRDVLRRATQKANKERELRAQREVAAKAELDAIELEFENIISKAITGLEAISALARLPQIRKLVNARDAIGEDTVLYDGATDAAERDTRIQIGFQKDIVSISIWGERPSLVQSSGALTSFTECRIERTFSIKAPVKPIDRTWLKNVFAGDFHLCWDSWEFDPLYINENPTTSRSTLDKFAGTDVRLARKVIEEEFPREFEPNLLLLRFLTDCADENMLAAYLEEALTKLH